METHITRKLVPEANGEPETLVEELPDVMIVDRNWWVMVEHTGSDGAIQLPFGSHQEAIAFLDRIEETFDAGQYRIRVDADRLISLKSFRQAWVTGPVEY